MTFTTRPELAGASGMVASTHWLASSAGMAVLGDGVREALDPRTYARWGTAGRATLGWVKASGMRQRATAKGPVARNL